MGAPPVHSAGPPVISCRCVFLCADLPGLSHWMRRRLHATLRQCCRCAFFCGTATGVFHNGRVTRRLSYAGPIDLHVHVSFDASGVNQASEDLLGLLRWRRHASRPDVLRLLNNVGPLDQAERVTPSRPTHSA